MRKLLAKRPSLDVKNALLHVQVFPHSEIFHISLGPLFVGTRHREESAANSFRSPIVSLGTCLQTTGQDTMHTQNVQVSHHLKHTCAESTSMLTTETVYTSEYPQTSKDITLVNVMQPNEILTAFSSVFLMQISPTKPHYKVLCSNK